MNKYSKLVIIFILKFNFNVTVNKLDRGAQQDGGHQHRHPRQPRNGLRLLQAEDQGPARAQAVPAEAQEGAGKRDPHVFA